MSQNAIDRSEQLFGYCAHCDKVWGGAAREDLGRSIACPRSNKHHAVVVKGDVGKFWLRVEKYLMWWELRASPFRWGNDRIFRKRAGIYITFRFFIIVSGLYLVDSKDFVFVSSVIVLISIVFMIDIIISNTSIAFITRFPARPLRSVIFTLFAFLQIVAIFSIYYKLSEEYILTSKVLTEVQAFYFSLVTITTLGYGDLFPALHRTPMLLLICFELVIGLYFLTLIVTIIASWSMSSPTRQRPLHVSELETPEDD